MVDRSEAVALAYVCGDTVIYSWMRSVLALLDHDTASHGRIAAGGHIAIRCGSGDLVAARNQAVASFLRYDRADWLFMVDTDMGFRPDTVERLLEAADPETAPVVGALCFAQREEAPDQLGGYRCLAAPTVMDWVEGEGPGFEYGWRVRWDYEADTLARVDGTGAACILIHRSVFERIEAAYGPVWYDRIPNTSTGTLIGEDLSFCLRARELGIPMFVHTGIPTTHFKHLWLGEAEYREQALRRSAQESPLRLPGVKTLLLAVEQLAVYHPEDGSDD